MKTIKFASIVMGAGYDPNEQQAHFSNEWNDTYFYGVSDLTSACTLAKKLKEEGFQCIELCGAFGKEGAEQIIEATENKVAVGYSIHLQSQDTLFDSVFG